jgi:hypothetical protein
MNQIELHKKILELIKQKIDSVDFEEIRKLIDTNSDSRDYFFAVCDPNWINELYKNGFLDKIKQPAEDTTSYRYQMPELNYLSKVVETKPDEVTKIILDTKISEDNFNPEVIDRFQRIISELPVKNIIQLVPKIREENWARLMGKFSQFGFDYEEILNKIFENKEYDSLVQFADVTLSVKEKNEIERISEFSIRGNPFYLSDLSHIKVFKYLSEVGDKNVEDALTLSVNKLSEIIKLGDKTPEGSIFEINEDVNFYEVDFINTIIDFDNGNHYSYEDSLQKLSMVIQVLTERFKEINKEHQRKIREFYSNVVINLPKSRTAWKFKIFFYSLFREIFKNEIKDEIFVAVSTEKGGDYYSQSYYKFIQENFDLLSDAEKRDYIKKTINKFDDSKGMGRRTLSSIFSYLTEDEVKKANEKFELVEDYKPEMVHREVTSGTVTPIPAGDDSDWSDSVDKIVDKLKTIWSPEVLAKDPESKNTFKPKDVEGTGDRLKEEYKKRPEEFISQAELFFDREKIDAHYTYDFLRATEDILKSNILSKDVDLNSIISMMNKIVTEGKQKTFVINKEIDTWGWRANWQSVLMALTDVIHQLLKDDNKNYKLDFDSHRSDLLEAIEFLLRDKDPEIKDEQNETAKIRTQEPDSKNYVASDPFTTAINSTRGRAFQALVFFVYKDGEKLKDDVKGIYENLLEKEKTQALYFMFGHYMATFYYRDKEDLKWMHKQLDNIFPEDKNKRDLFFASLEGYFANNLFEEIFFDEKIQELYKKAIDVSKDKTERKYFRDPDAGIAVHIALAFLHYKDKFGVNNQLYRYFWQNGSEEQHSEFVNYIGSALISGDSTRIYELIKKDKDVTKRIKDFWIWMLEKYDKSPEPFKEFGFWVNLDKDIFSAKEIAKNMNKTLEKTKGVLEWDYGLSKNIEKLAEASPEDTLKIAEYHIYNAGVQNKENRKYMHLDENWHEAFKILYNNKSTKEGAKLLISNLMRDGGRTFWRLEDII